MADVRTLARRYARALLDVARERNAVDQIEGDLQALVELRRRSPELRALFNHPSLGREQKQRVLREALSGKVHDATLGLLDVLVEKKRLFALEEIAHEFDRVSDKVQGIARVEARSFLPLTDAQKAKLTAKLQARRHKTRIVLDEKVDPSLLGGIVLRLDDLVIDGSVAGRLKRLKERLLLREEERAQQAARNAAEALGE